MDDSPAPKLLQPVTDREKPLLVRFLLRHPGCSDYLRARDAYDATLHRDHDDNRVTFDDRRQYSRDHDCGHAYVYGHRVHVHAGGHAHHEDESDHGPNDRGCAHDCAHDGGRDCAHVHDRDDGRGRDHGRDHGGDRGRGHAHGRDHDDGGGVWLLQV